MSESYQPYSSEKVRPCQHLFREIATMPHTEIWRCRTAWHATTPQTRQRILQKLGQLVRAHAASHDDCGPFLTPHGDSYLLFWSVQAEYADQLRGAYARLNLDKYFEPLMYGTAGNLSARDYLERFSNHH